MSLIISRGLIKNYVSGETEVKALRELSFTINRGAFVSFIGPSGSGKTTLLNLIGLLDKPTGGFLSVAGTEVGAIARKEAARFRGKHIGFIFQNFNLIPVLSVFENVEYPLVMVQKTAAGEGRKRVLELLEAVGMSDQVRKRPDQLSGGQKQRVAIARALVTRPDLVLADEPTANLDHDTAQTIIGLMKRIRDDLGTTFIFSTHDTRIISQVETIHELEDGKLTDTDGTGGAVH